jgi:hypothetical protein
VAADLLTRVRAEIQERLAALRPAVAEYRRLLGAADAIGLGPDGTPVAARAATTPSRDEAERRALRATAAKTPPKAKPRSATPRPRGASKARAAAAPRQPRLGAVEQAIMAALEHGSHTLGELGIVTAMSAADLRGGLRRLLAAGRIVRSNRAGRAAYVLSGSE